MAPRRTAVILVMFVTQSFGLLLGTIGPPPPPPPPRGFPSPPHPSFHYSCPTLSAHVLPALTGHVIPSGACKRGAQPATALVAA